VAVNGTLFPLPEEMIEHTSDDCYTPRWVFDAMGLRFEYVACCALDVTGLSAIYATTPP
jgi:hypothetical protein